MKRCPECRRTFNDESLRFCLYDGKPLQDDAPAAPSYAPPPPAPPPYAPPPSASAYPAPPPSYAPPQYPPPQYPPPGYGTPGYGTPPYGTPPKKSGWKLAGGIAAAVIVGNFVRHAVQAPKPAPNPPGAGSPAGSAPAGPSPDSRPAGGDSPSRDTPPSDAPPPSAQPSEAPTPSAAPPSDSELRDSVISAVRRADDAEIEAFRQADPAPLYGVYSGAALQKQIKVLELLKKTNLVVETRLKSQEFGAVHVASDRSDAQVDVKEDWSMTFYSPITHKSLRKPSNLFVQTLTLVHGDKGWTVDDSVDNSPDKN